MTSIDFDTRLEFVLSILRWISKAERYKGDLKMVLQTSRSILRATFPASATKTCLEDVGSGRRHKILVCRVIGSPLDLSSVRFRALRASVCKD